MGLLDDAIRQHLDLKRQHGADESDVRRKEDEALGPARREAPAADQALADEHAQPDGEEPGAEPGAEEALPEIDDPAEITAAEELAESEELAADDLVADLPESATGPAPLEPDLLEEDSPFHEPFAPGEAGAEPPEGEIVEGEVLEESELLEEGEILEEDEGVLEEGEVLAEGEDVLEETPEFLQETPEHDRLWFEQKPPRDFDFDDDK